MSEKVTFADAVKSAFKHFVQFRGVASRSHYWYFRLFLALVSIVASTIDSVIAANIGQASTNFNPISFTASLAFLLPDLSVTIRRFRDAGFSPHWAWGQLVVLVGVISSLIFAFSKAPEVLQLIEQETPDLADLPPAEVLAAAFTPFLLVALASSVYFIFVLVVTLRPSKSAAQGNKYLLTQGGAGSDF